MEPVSMHLGETILNFTGTLALNLHQLSKKCLNRMQKKVAYQEKMREERRHKFLTKMDKAPVNSPLGQGD